MQFFLDDSIKWLVTEQHVQRIHMKSLQYIIATPPAMFCVKLEFQRNCSTVDVYSTSYILGTNTLYIPLDSL